MSVLQISITVYLRLPIDGEDLSFKTDAVYVDFVAHTDNVPAYFVAHAHVKSPEIAEADAIDGEHHVGTLWKRSEKMNVEKNHANEYHKRFPLSYLYLRCQKHPKIL